MAYKAKKAAEAGNFVILSSVCGDVKQMMYSSEGLSSRHTTLALAEAAVAKLGKKMTDEEVAALYVVEIKGVAKRCSVVYRNA